MKLRSIMINPLETGEPTSSIALRGQYINNLRGLDDRVRDFYDEYFMARLGQDLSPVEIRLASRSESAFRFDVGDGRHFGISSSPLEGRQKPPRLKGKFPVLSLIEGEANNPMGVPKVYGIFNAQTPGFENPLTYHKQFFAVVLGRAAVDTLSTRLGLESIYNL